MLGNVYIKHFLSTRMKLKFYIVALFVLVFNIAQGQTTYTISSDKNWSSVLPNTCANCSIVISYGATLTIDKSVTCQNCTFQGGNISMTDQTLNIQYTGNSVVTTNFKNVDFKIYGNNGKVIVNAPLALASSTVTFYNGSYFNTSYQVDLTSSTINLYDNATMYSTGSSSTSISLSSLSKITIGDGSRNSKAAFTVSGPTVKMYDLSSIAVSNNNNVYYNWSDYYATTAHSTNASLNKSYSTSNSAMNCGGNGQNACSNPSLYGPATLSTSGVVPGNTLPVILSGFSVKSNNDGTAALSWETKMEQNSSRFEIERSADGRGWSTIGMVQASGNASLPTDYSYADSRMLTGTNYYRLKMVDLDGSAVYSEVKVLQGAVIDHISFYPNPARDYVNVTLGGSSAGMVTVRLINQAGVVLQEKSVPGASGTTVTFPLQQAASGWYVLNVSSQDGMHVSSKLLINRM